MKLSGNIAITKSNGKRKFSSFDFASFEFFFLPQQGFVLISFHLPFYYGIRDKVNDFVGYLLSMFAGPYYKSFWSLSLPWLHLSAVLSSLRMCWSIYSCSFLLFLPLRHSFCSSGNFTP